jgi:nitroreductase
VVEWTGPADSPTPASLTLVRAPIARAEPTEEVAAPPPSSTATYLAGAALLLALVSLGLSLRPRGGAA